MREILDSLELENTSNDMNINALPSCFAVSQLASSSIGAVGCAIAKLMQDLGIVRESPNVRVDQTLASLWFAQSIHPVGWQLPPVWDDIAGDYQTMDGWIRLHTNLPKHKNAALEVLGVKSLRNKVAEVLKHEVGDVLERLIVEAGGVAAKMRTPLEWLNHPQGIALRSEPLIHWHGANPIQVSDWNPTLQRPLDGLKVLDLTRVLAGPVATRTLAGLGAKVLRIDPPAWEEANIVPDITLGKRCAYMDLKQAEGKKIFEELLYQADILVHGYRPEALNKLGLDSASIRHISPNIIDISLDAYGWTGPWSKRRGFDSLVQMSSGIAAQGMHWAKTNKPCPLPVQALDHATGYLMAAAAIRAISFSLGGKSFSRARLSLARTAELLKIYPQSEKVTFDNKAQQNHFASAFETTPWGQARRLRPALNIEGTEMKWDREACELGSHKPSWSAS